MMMSSLKYSYFPLQRILAQHPNVSKPAFLDTSFVFCCVESEHLETEVTIGNSRLLSIPISIKISESEIMSKFDFTLTVQHNQTTNQLSCTIDASLDLFNRTTVDKIAQRFHSMLEQLFKRTFDQQTIQSMSQHFQHFPHQVFRVPSICDLSILLPNELQLINDLNNTYVDYGEISCIQTDIARRAQQHPQKIALVLANGSMSYGELIYYTQYLASHLITKYTIKPGQVICQLLERSFEMVIGMIAIMMCGAIYTPLSPREPLARLLTCIKQTSAQLVFQHHATQHITLTMCSLLPIDQIIFLYEKDEKNFSSVDLVGVTSEHISHIVFTSGSTGIPKAVCR
jgi:hypothetical protein